MARECGALLRPLLCGFRRGRCTCVRTGNSFCRIRSPRPVKRPPAAQTQTDGRSDGRRTRMQRDEQSLNTENTHCKSFRAPQHSARGTLQDEVKAEDAVGHAH